LTRIIKKSLNNWFQKKEITDGIPQWFFTNYANKQHKLVYVNIVGEK